MARLTKLVLMAATLMAAAGVQAQIYGGAGVGLNSLKTTSTATGSAVTSNTGTVGAAAYIGYEFNENVAVEVEGRLTNLFAVTTQATTELDPASNSSNDAVVLAAVVLTQPLNDQFSIFGRAGLTAGLKVSSGGEAVKSTFAFGVGGRYHLDDKTSIRVEYTRYSDAVGAFGVSMQKAF